MKFIKNYNQWRQTRLIKQSIKSDFIDFFKSYWNQRNERERLMLGCGGVCLLTYLFYTLLYSPLALAVHKTKMQLIEDKATLSWMYEARRQVRPHQKSQVLSNNQLLAVLGEQLNQDKFKSYPYKLEQTSSNDIQLSFDAVPYPAFMTWLSTLSLHYAVLIKQLKIEQTKTSGVVKSFLVIAVNVEPNGSTYVR